MVVAVNDRPAGCEAPHESQQGRWGRERARKGDARHGGQDKRVAALPRGILERGGPNALRKSVEDITLAAKPTARCRKLCTFHVAEDAVVGVSALYHDLLGRPRGPDQHGSYVGIGKHVAKQFAKRPSGGNDVPRGTRAQSDPSPQCPAHEARRMTKRRIQGTSAPPLRRCARRQEKARRGPMRQGRNARTCGKKVRPDGPMGRFVHGRALRKMVRRIRAM